MSIDKVINMVNYEIIEDLVNKAINNIDGKIALLKSEKSLLQYGKITNYSNLIKKYVKKENISKIKQNKVI